IAQVVQVDAVHDMFEAALASYLLQACEQFILAVKTAVRIVAHVVGIVELVSLDVLVRNAETFDKCLSVPLVRGGKRSRIGGHGDGICAQYAVGGPRQIGGIRTTGEGNDHAAQRAETGEKA